jgi:hypothetical protein
LAQRDGERDEPQQRRDLVQELTRSAIACDAVQGAVP